MFDACERSSHWCVWMDADTFVHSNWTYDQFKNLLPNDKWLTYVGRGKGSRFILNVAHGLNLKDAICKDLKEFERVYEDAENGIFQIGRMARFFCVW